MTTRTLGGRALIGAVLAAFLASLWPTASAWADPPPWAPAHGYRAKEKHKGKRKGRGDDHAVYVMPYGLSNFTCSRELVGSVIGGVAGAAVGSQIGKGDGRTAAVIGGTILGVMVGGAIGRSMDRVDQACVGQVLEHVPDSQPIVWNGIQQERYTVIPTRTWQVQDGRYCREYQTRATIGGRVETLYGKACRQPDGAWQIVS